MTETHTTTTIEMSAVQSLKILHTLTLPDGGHIRCGWHCSSRGTRYGWAHYTAAGECTWLGGSAAGVVNGRADLAQLEVKNAIEAAL